MLNETKSRCSGLSKTKSRFSGKTVKILLLLITFFISASLVQAQSYDYLIIIPDVLNGTWSTTLTNLQTSRGFHPVVVTVSENTSAQDIKDYTIDYYYNNYPLKYVLLVGNGMNDPADGPININAPYDQFGKINSNVDYTTGNYIPFFSVTCNNPFSQFGTSDVPTDDPYVEDLTSHGNVYIGRAPVNSSDEASAYVSKLQTYYNALKSNVYSDANNR
jgi:Peptidase family C25